jgi:hypothetical protein
MIVGDMRSCKDTAEAIMRGIMLGVPLGFLILGIRHHDLFLIFLGAGFAWFHLHKDYGFAIPFFRRHNP